MTTLSVPDASFSTGPTPRLAVFCRTGAHFMDDILDHLGRAYAIRHFQGRSVDEMADLMRWGDIAWFEWCDKTLIRASRMEKTCRIVCRLHSFEAFTDWPAQVAWENVDALVFVAPHVRDLVLEQVPDLERRVAVRVVHNGIRLDRFPFRDRPRGFDIASVGYINHKKNPSLLLQCIGALVDRDERFRLHLAGVHQELRFQRYMDHMIQAMGLADHVVFHGWVDDIPAWLDDKHFLLTTSVFESFGYGIAEAMAAGLKPLIHNFPGAARLYPRELTFNTIAQCVDSALSDDYAPAAYRRFVEENYRLEFQLRGIDRVLQKVME